MGDKDLAQRLGEHGRERAQELFSIETSANALRELFKRLSRNADSFGQSKSRTHSIARR